MRFTVVAWTLTSTSLSLGAGVGTSTTCTTSGGPYRVCTAALHVHRNRRPIAVERRDRRLPTLQNLRQVDEYLPDCTVLDGLCACGVCEGEPV